MIYLGKGDLNAARNLMDQCIENGTIDDAEYWKTRMWRNKDLAKKEERGKAE